jgi:hypothetical protein
MAGPEVSKKYQTLIYLAGSASAEFFADIALCPFEAVKARALVHSEGTLVLLPFVFSQLSWLSMHACGLVGVRCCVSAPRTLAMTG